MVGLNPAFRELVDLVGNISQQLRQMPHPIRFGWESWLKWQSHSPPRAFILTLIERMRIGPVWFMVIVCQRADRMMQNLP